ncbi:hypothetical protein B0H17DRAFT_1218395 [Mycena rosella]|uniref:Uncharacterized protein n=1 Tax=Mycena rosella TaxID=1033263 RepID=A0AAD7BQJ0_MYCRO|nr:hypothetical protein B0H17DRAFT_1218395 [Mycena rosella]
MLGGCPPSPRARCRTGLVQTDRIHEEMKGREKLVADNVMYGGSFSYRKRGCAAAQIFRTRSLPTGCATKGREQLVVYGERKLPQRRSNSACCLERLRVYTKQRHATPNVFFPASCAYFLVFPRRVAPSSRLGSPPLLPYTLPFVLVLRPSTRPLTPTPDYKYTAPDTPPPPAVDDAIRRPEEEELQGVLEMSMRDRGGGGGGALRGAGGGGQYASSAGASSSATNASAAPGSRCAAVLAPRSAHTHSLDAPPSRGAVTTRVLSAADGARPSPSSHPDLRSRAGAAKTRVHVRIRPRAPLR